MNDLHPDLKRRPRLFPNRGRADRAARKFVGDYPLIHSTLFSHGMWAVVCGKGLYLLEDGTVGPLPPAGEVVR